MHIIIFDPTPTRDNLLPITYTRPVGDIRVGITTLAEKWKRYVPGDYSWYTDRYLSAIYPCRSRRDRPDTIIIAGDVIATDVLGKAVASMKPGDAIYDHDGQVVAIRGEEKRDIHFDGEIKRVKMLYDVFNLNGYAISIDFEAITAGRKSEPLPESCTLIGPVERLFIEPGAKVEGAMLNTREGHIYIAADAEVMEGSCLRGPVAVCNHAVVKMGSKIYGATTLGPWCKVGGELSNVVMQAYSNKAHDGFLGNAVIGEWCNLGAGCVASNLKNDYSEIKLWNYPAHRFLRTGLQFCGLIMGDHSKCGINTMLNTATVLGVGVNIHGAGFPRNFVASFQEGGAAGLIDVTMDKFFVIAERMMERRGITLTDEQRRMFMSIREIAENYR